VSYMLPKLLFRSSGWWSETTLLIAAYAIAGVGFVLALTRKRSGEGAPLATRDVGLLLLFVLIACVSIFSLSEAGSNRGWTVRYIAALYLVVPIFLSIGIGILWTWSKALSIAIVAILLIPNILLYGLPGSKLRADLTLQLQSQMHTREQLAIHDVQMV